MDHRSTGADAGERMPLDAGSHQYLSSPSRHPQPPISPSLRQEADTSSFQPSPNNSPSQAGRPGAHSDFDFALPRELQGHSPGYEAAAAGATPSAIAGSVTQSPDRAPPPPLHQEHASGPRQHQGYAQVPGDTALVADEPDEAAFGAPVGSTIANRNADHPGPDAMAGTPYRNDDYGRYYEGEQPTPNDALHGYQRGYYDQSPGLLSDPFASQGYNESSHSLATLGPAAMASSDRMTSSRSQRSLASDPFSDPHSVYGQRMEPGLGQFNPNDIMDDGDEGLEYNRPRTRTSKLSLKRSSARASKSAVAAGAAAGGAAAAAGGVLGLGATSQGDYGPVENTTAYQGAGAGQYVPANPSTKEQSEWIAKQAGSRRKWKWIIGSVLALLVIGGIVGGILGGVVFKKHSSADASSDNNGNGQSAADDESQNGDLSISSAEIQALLGNKNLHKVFPGVDYTPINTQYPDCLKNPPSQNNITRDVAVLSQLTNKIRLYGTDCNQTEMTIHALKQLKMEDDIKIWLGVWQDNNETTNARQLSQMWDILNTYGDTHFEGLIVANEILFREQMSVTDLGSLLEDVRKNLTSMGLSLPVATSDLGDKWTAALAEQSDYVMANIHPFFGGVNAKDAAAWTYSFWENNNGAYFKANASRNIISETGWPTTGGTDCGSATVTDCPDASVAGISQLNQFLEDWVCAALENGTNYFWFEMFDEPWKIMYDTETEAWEDHWGIMDVNRKLKDGVTIPDCGGKTVG